MATQRKWRNVVYISKHGTRYHKSKECKLIQSLPSTKDEYEEIPLWAAKTLPIRDYGADTYEPCPSCYPHKKIK